MCATKLVCLTPTVYKYVPMGMHPEFQLLHVHERRADWPTDYVNGTVTSPAASDHPQSTLPAAPRPGALLPILHSFPIFKEGKENGRQGKSIKLPARPS